jgi:hypothetical protein
MRSVRVRCMLLLFPIILSTHLCAQFRIESQFRIARVKYTGGGDWYNDPSAEVNLLKFVREQTGMDVDPRYEFVELTSDRLFAYPFLFITGHGTIAFSDAEVRQLRTYLTNGGFLYADDDYGMDASFRREMKKVFPEASFVELPFTHPIYSSFFPFPNGVPKTHEHDKNPPQGFGLFIQGRMVAFYTFESNPSDGWVDATVHGDPESVRQEALRFGTNIVVWAATR